jgi:ABC-type dipeptide/oligopeptide/nickel transport system permease component
MTEVIKWTAVICVSALMASVTLAVIVGVFVSMTRKPKR